MTQSIFPPARHEGGQRLEPLEEVVVEVRGRSLQRGMVGMIKLSAMMQLSALSTPDLTNPLRRDQSTQVNDEHAGAVIEALGLRRGELNEMCPAAGSDSSGGAVSRQRLVFEVPSRGMVGFR
jgi:predicted membrane GTPase involved in stress response